MANPETVYTNRFRKKMTRFMHGVKVYKHSDRFNGGIADLHFTLPGGRQAWIEVKCLKQCVTHRKAGVTELQDEFLKEHWANGIHGFVLVGVGQKSSLCHISMFDGSVYATDLRSDEGAIAHLLKMMED